MDPLPSPYKNAIHNTHAYLASFRVSTMYTSYISATFKRKPGEGVDHDLTNHTSLSSRFIAYSGSIRKEIRAGCRSRLQTMFAGSQAHHPGATWYTVPLCLVCPKPTCTGCHLVDY